jgi:hypothetical protein
VTAASGHFVTASSAIAGTKGVQAISSGVDLNQNHERVKDLQVEVLRILALR